MSTYSELIIKRFRQKGILIDTNLLLLYAVGSFDPEILDPIQFKRLAAYSKEDFQLLGRLLTLFARRVTTPHVLAEVSNFIGQLTEQKAQGCRLHLRQTLSGFEELPVDSFRTASNPKFKFLGLTDMALAEVADDFLIVTDDLRFVRHLNEMSKDALNINHLRQEAASAR